MESVEIEADECESKSIETETLLEESHTPQLPTEEILRSLQGLPEMSKKSRNSDGYAETSNTKISIETRKLLRMNFFLVGDREAFDRYPEVKAKYKELLTRERDTGMTEEEQEQILLQLRYMMGVNQDTFIDLLLPALMRDLQHKEHHLAHVENQMFDSDSIPQALDPGNNKTLKVLLHWLPKPETPKPHFCFGLREEAFTPEERMLNDCSRQYTVLSKPLYHCFFAVEFKTLDGGWGQCQTRCCRTGSAMVHATEKLLRLASPDEEHPLEDDQLRQEPCMAFTLAVDPVIAKLNVHWAEPYEKGTIYHMHKMKIYTIIRREQLNDLRHDVNCILDWGCVDRKTSIQETLAKIKANNGVMPTASIATPPSKGGNESAADENWEHVNQAGDASGA